MRANIEANTSKVSGVNSRGHGKQFSASRERPQKSGTFWKKCRTFPQKCRTFCHILTAQETVYHCTKNTGRGVVPALCVPDKVCIYHPTPNKYPSIRRAKVDWDIEKQAFQPRRSRAASRKSGRNAQQGSKQNGGEDSAVCVWQGIAEWARACQEVSDYLRALETSTLVK